MASLESKLKELASNCVHSLTKCCDMCRDKRINRLELDTPCGYVSCKHGLWTHANGKCAMEGCPCLQFEDKPKEVSTVRNLRMEVTDVFVPNSRTYVDVQVIGDKIVDIVDAVSRVSLAQKLYDSNKAHNLKMATIETHKLGPLTGWMPPTAELGRVRKHLASTITQQPKSINVVRTRSKIEQELDERMSAPITKPVSMLVEAKVGETWRQDSGDTVILCEDEGCPQYGTQHVCVSKASVSPLDRPGDSKPKGCQHWDTLAVLKWDRTTGLYNMSKIVCVSCDMRMFNVCVTADGNGLSIVGQASK